MRPSTGILSVCVRTFTFSIYSCSNSTITHAQNLCSNFSHTLCVRVATCACQRSSRSARVSVENKNKPVSLPIVVLAQARPMMQYASH